ncbi:MAG TPA: hypothetical protein VHE60_16345 [Pyrinomonadaceae bacterium]|nr:hypothetical protein [Pyrinomonadaceae bacterium]
MSKPQSDLIQSCFHTEVSRRDFFDRLVKFGITGAIATFIPTTVFSRALAPPPPKQDNWRRCNKCLAMFYNGYRDKGRCPKGGAHMKRAEDVSNFKLTYDSAGPGQRDWRFCNKCHALFFDGYPNKGVCPAGGGHFAQGFNFTLLHDTNVPGQRDWRFCNKCEVMFYNGWDEKGVCAARGVHVAAGYNFVLDNTVPFD